MPKYIVTDRAGRYVAGFRNPSSGTVIEISESEARYELVLGTIVAVPEESPSGAEPVSVPPEVEASDSEPQLTIDATANKPLKKKR